MTESPKDQLDLNASLTRIAEVAELVVTGMRLECVDQQKPETTPLSSWRIHDLANMSRNEYVRFLYRLGFFQAEIGKWLGLHQTTVGQIIRGEQNG